MDEVGSRGTMHYYDDGYFKDVYKNSQENH